MLAKESIMFVCIAVNSFECMVLQSPWGATTTKVVCPCSFTDVMSEQLAKQLDDESHYFPDFSK